MIRAPGASRICITGCGSAADARDAVIAAGMQAGLERDAARGADRAVELGMSADSDEPDDRLAHELASAVGARGSVRWASGDLAGIASLSEAMTRIREGPGRLVLAGGVGARSVVFVLEHERTAVERRAVPLAWVLAVRSGWDRRLPIRGGDPDFDPVESARVFRWALGDARRKAADLDIVFSQSTGLPQGAAERAIRRALGHLENRVPIEHQAGPDAAAGAGIAAVALQRIVDGANLVAAQAFSDRGLTVALVLERAR
jgi:3-oxoacyl-(acyl-carrier-protein) synthase